jgi:uncharacterized protein YjbI with pentapeptide repeats
MAIQVKGRGYPLVIEVVSDNVLSASYNGGTGIAITSAGLISGATFSGTNMYVTTITATTYSATSLSGTNCYVTTVTATNATAANISADTLIIDTAIQTPAGLSATATSGGSAVYAGIVSAATVCAVTMSCTNLTEAGGTYAPANINVAAGLISAAHMSATTTISAAAAQIAGDVSAANMSATAAVKAATVTATTFSGTDAHVTTVTATTLSATDAHVTTVTATTLSATDAHVTTVTGTTLSATNAHVTTVTATTHSGTNSHVTTVTAQYVTLSDSISSNTATSGAKMGLLVNETAASAEQLGEATLLCADAWMYLQVGANDFYIPLIAASNTSFAS